MNYSGNKTSKSFYFDDLFPQDTHSQLFLLKCFLLILSYIKKLFFRSFKSDRSMHYLS